MTSEAVTGGRILDIEAWSRVRMVWPDLPAGSVRVIEHGRNCLVLDIDDALIVERRGLERRPRHEGGIRW